MLGVTKEFFCNAEMFGFLIRCCLDAQIGKREKRSSWQAHQNRGVGYNKKLEISCLR